MNEGIYIAFSKADTCRLHQSRLVRNLKLTKRTYNEKRWTRGSPYVCSLFDCQTVWNVFHFSDIGKPTLVKFCLVTFPGQSKTFLMPLSWKSSPCNLICIGKMHLLTVLLALICRAILSFSSSFYLLNEIQQHRHVYMQQRAGQQGPIRTLTAARKNVRSSCTVIVWRIELLDKTAQVWTTLPV